MRFRCTDWFWFDKISDKFSDWRDYRYISQKLLVVDYKGNYIPKAFATEVYKIEPRDNAVDITGVEYLTKVDSLGLGYNIIESEKEIAFEADRFFVNNHSEVYVQNFWFNFNNDKLINSVFEIMQNDNHFKALMVQKISYMEIKTSTLDEYSKKRDSLIKLLKIKLKK